MSGHSWGGSPPIPRIPVRRQKASYLASTAALPASRGGVSSVLASPPPRTNDRGDGRYQARSAIASLTGAERWCEMSGANIERVRTRSLFVISQSYSLLFASVGYPAQAPAGLAHRACLAALEGYQPTEGPSRKIAKSTVFCQLRVNIR